MTPHHSRHSLISENIPFLPSPSIMKDICAPAPAGGAHVFHLYVHPGLFLRFENQEIKLLRSRVNHWKSSIPTLVEAV